MIPLAFLFLQSLTLSPPTNLTVSITDAPNVNGCPVGEHPVPYSATYVPEVTICFREANCKPDEFAVEVYTADGVRSDVAACVAWQK